MEKEKNKKDSQKEYRAKSIEVLKGLEPVRRRPGMFIGTTEEPGIFHLIRECIDNACDEALAGYAKNIKVSFLKEDKVMVEEDGRGIPVDIHPVTKKSALETVMCTLHAGGKFSSKVYQISGGLHGVGVSVVNALSDWMRVEVKREGYLWSQEYKRGKPITKVKKEKKVSGTGTKVIFHPDPEIFEKIELNPKKVISHLREQAFLTPKVKFIFCDQRKEIPSCFGFYNDAGILSFLKTLTFEREIIQEEIFYVNEKYQEVFVEVAFCYTDDLQSKELSFANNIKTTEGGTHLTGFRAALTRALNEYAKKNNLFKNGEGPFLGDDVREGLYAIISVKLKEPQFEGQVKAKLGNPEAKTATEAVVFNALQKFLEENPSDAKKIFEKCLVSYKARKAARAAKESIIKKSLIEGLSLPGKLADCSSRKPEERELFIVEGESAGGSAKQARDRRFQAILPLRGKILNVEKVHLDRILASKEIRSLVIALGTAIAESFDLNKLRYHRIIIMTDADTDGAHIRTLLLTLFYRYFQPIIEKGYLYIARPPLYRIQSGKKVEYAYSEEEKAKILEEILKLKKKDKSASITIQRYKGLGEMNPEELWETTMNPEKRILLKVTIEDAKEADRIFDILMGSEVEPRKRFIQTYAKEVKNLDI
ncbi:type IIA DNA topoisomerase subunit B [bacterium]|nr:type IIA DNA topoisomerase subunit B [bacterium]